MTFFLTLSGEHWRYFLLYSIVESVFSACRAAESYVTDWFSMYMFAYNALSSLILRPKPDL